MVIYNLVYKMGDRCDWRSGLTREQADQTRSYVLECKKGHPEDSPVTEALNTILSNLDSVFPVSEETQWPTVTPCLALEAPPITREVCERLRVTCEGMLNNPSLGEASHTTARTALAALDRLEERWTAEEKEKEKEKEQKEGPCALHGAADEEQRRLGYSQRSDGAYSTFAPPCSCASASTEQPTEAHSSTHYTGALLNDDDLYS
jgi:hypothetical protein